MTIAVGSEQSISDTQELRVAAGLWLKEIREAAGLSQRELSRILGFEYYTFISQLENGRGRVPTNKYRDYARAVGVDAKTFVKKLLRFYDPVSYEVLFADADQAA